MKINRKTDLLSYSSNTEDKELESDTLSVTIKHFAAGIQWIEKNNNFFYKYSILVLKNLRKDQTKKIDLHK